jgi:hypothetical protein
VAKMTEKMKAVCVGRFLVDVPVEAEVRLSREMMAGFEVSTVEESEAEFRQRIAATEADIGARGADPNGDGGMVQARDLRVAGMVGRVLIHGYSRGYMMEGDRRVDMASVSVEAHGHLHGVSFSLSAKSTQESSADEAEALLARLRVRGEEEIPSVPGFCIWRGVFAEPLPPHQTEHVVLSIALPRHPEVALVLSCLPGGGVGQGLLERAARTDAEASADEMLRVTKVRVGRRSINSIGGEEVLERIRELNFATTYGFMWESPGVEHDPLHPFLSFELQSGLSERSGGKPADSTLHPDAVLALWDIISSTIRLRKSDPPPPAKLPEPTGPKLGTTVRAGDVCPHSGWWECSAGGDGLRVHGGQVQFLRAGERVPQPLLLPQQTLWQKLRGVQPSIEPDRLTVWQLVDKRSRPRIAATVALASAGVGTALDVRSAGSGAVVGSYVRTGDACPASGWWRCEESHALDGTRWFAAGSLLPAATFRVPQGVFGRAAGPEVIQRRSAWQLVRHAEVADVQQPDVENTASVAADMSPAHDDPPSLA